MNACEKYYWILEHPAFINADNISPIIEMEPHMVCPSTNRIEEYKKLNTKLQLWIEMLVPYKDSDGKYIQAHDWNLDCGGDSWEDAINNLYNLIVQHYGTYTEEEYDKKYLEVTGVDLNNLSMFNNFSSKKIITTKSIDTLQENKLDHKEMEFLVEDINVYKNSIQALTEYRKTCSIDEYEEVDEQIQTKKFHLFECELSERIGISVED